MDERGILFLSKVPTTVAEKQNDLEHCSRHSVPFYFRISNASPHRLAGLQKAIMLDAACLRFCNATAIAGNEG